MRRRNSSYSARQRRLLATIAHGEQIKQVAEHGDESGDIGQCRSIQDLVNAGNLGARLHNPHLLENDFRAARGIEFDRQSDQLEDEKDQITVDTKRNQTSEMEKQTAENDEGQHAGSKH